MTSECFLKQKHTVKSIVLSVLCHLSQTVYLTQQNIISSSNGQLASPFDKHILLGNDITMQYFSCHVEIRCAYWHPPCSLSFYLLSPFCCQIAFIYLIIWQRRKKYYHRLMRQLKCPLLSPFLFRWQRQLPGHNLTQCPCVFLSKCAGLCVLASKIRFQR